MALMVSLTVAESDTETEPTVPRAATSSATVAASLVDTLDIVADEKLSVVLAESVTERSVGSVKASVSAMLVESDTLTWPNPPRNAASNSLTVDPSETFRLVIGFSDKTSETVDDSEALKPPSTDPAVTSLVVAESDNDTNSTFCAVRTSAVVALSDIATVGVDIAATTISFRDELSVTLNWPKPETITASESVQVVESETDTVSAVVAAASTSDVVALSETFG